MGFVHCLLHVLCAPLFPQVMLPWKGCRAPHCPTPTSASTSGQKMISSVSEAPGMDGEGKTSRAHL